MVNVISSLVVVQVMNGIAVTSVVKLYAMIASFLMVAIVPISQVVPSVMKRSNAKLATITIANYAQKTPSVDMEI